MLKIFEDEQSMFNYCGYYDLFCNICGSVIGFVVMVSTLKSNEFRNKKIFYE